MCYLAAIRLPVIDQIRKAMRYLVPLPWFAEIPIVRQHVPPICPLDE